MAANRHILAVFAADLAIRCHFLAAILPFLPPITPNVKLPIHATRLEFGIRAEVASDTTSKSGKNGNVHCASQHCLPTTLSPTRVGGFRGRQPSGAVSIARHFHIVKCFCVLWCNPLT
jgi:hypothetical protein